MLPETIPIELRALEKEILFLYVIFSVDMFYATCLDLEDDIIIIITFRNGHLMRHTDIFPSAVEDNFRHGLTNGFVYYNFDLLEGVVEKERVKING